MNSLIEYSEVAPCARCRLVGGPQQSTRCGRSECGHPLALSIYEPKSLQLIIGYDWLMVVVSLSHSTLANGCAGCWTWLGDCD